MRGKLRDRLRFIIENSYLELIILYTILISIFTAVVVVPILVGLIYSFAYFVREVTGDLLDPLVPYIRPLVSYGILIVAGFVFLILLIIFIIIIRARKGRFIEGLLLYDVFVNYDRDFKTLSGVVLPIIFMFIYLIHFILQLDRFQFDLLNIFVLAVVLTLGTTVIAYVGQINKIMYNIKNIGDLDLESPSNSQYLFTEKALGMLRDTDQNIKETIEEQLKSERLKTELITNISHDLKTPLTSIINYTDLIKKHGSFDNEVDQYIDVLDRNSQRLKVLITDLIYASKAETGNVDIELDVLEINELVSQVYGEFDFLFKEKDISFVFDPEEDIYVYSDSNHLARVLINLMDNAIKYSQEGTRIYASTSIGEKYITFSLKNISKAQLNISPDELMEQFVRGERARHTEGSGLGLYISRSLMELMGGKLILGIDGDLFEVKLLIPGIEENKYDL
ncbi:MAG: sensor histidine kinase [Tissierellaceae bacterium]|jgi:signal transduction histidine kinase|nr:HAMP domain-containing histidine kinase [Tissierellia bacterium]